MIAAALHGIAIADGVAVAVEGGAIHAIVIAQDGEILVVEVDVAFQIDIARVEVVPVAVVVVVHVVGIACQLGGIADMDALLLAAGAQLIVLEGVSVPQAVAVPGEVGAVLPEAGIVAPGAHVTLVGIRSSYAYHCHQKCEKYTFVRFHHCLFLFVLRLIFIG